MPFSEVVVLLCFTLLPPHLHSLINSQVIRHYHGHLSAIFCLKLHPTLDILITGGRDSAARIWDIRKFLRSSSWYDVGVVHWCVMMHLETKTIAAVTVRVLAAAVVVMVIFFCVLASRLNWICVSGTKQQVHCLTGHTNAVASLVRLNSIGWVPYWKFVHAPDDPHFFR